MSDGSGSLRFDPEWRISLVTAMLLPFLVLLGFWQLERADEKALLATTWELRRHQSPVQLSELDIQQPESLAYIPVQLTGRYLSQGPLSQGPLSQGPLSQAYFLLDNRIHGGKFGYEVVAPFSLSDSDLIVLVNRGWIVGDSSRRELPDVPLIAGDIQVIGHVYVAPGAPYLLADQVMAPDWPLRIQALELDKIEPLLHDLAPGRKLFPYPVRINAGQASALTVDWKIVNVSPQKHTGYAFQWFTMAAVLGVFYILRSSNLWQIISPNRRKPD